MTPARLLLGFLCIALLQVVPARAQSQDLAPAVALSHRVEQLKSAFSSGNSDSIRKAVADVEVMRRTFGTHDISPLVDAMSLWARQLGESGDAAKGLEVMKVLERWAPEQSIVLGTRITLQRQLNIRGYMDSLPDVLQLTKLRLSHPSHRWLWIMQHLAWVRMMASILLWGWAIALTLRYRNVLRYLWEMPLAKRGVHPIIMAVLGAVLLTLPLLAGVDPSLAAVFWLWLLTPFMYGPEVKATLLVVLLQLAHPALILLEPEAAKVPAPSIVRLQLQPQSHPLEESGIQGLPEMDREFLKGWQQLAKQDWAAAEATFDTLVTRHQDRAEVLNNRGVARFQQGKVDAAKRDFDEAAGLSTRLAPEISLNQGVIAFKQLDSGLGIAKQEEARLAAPDYTKGLLNANQSMTDPRTFAVPLPDTPERTALLAGGSQPKGADWAGSIRDRRILVWVTGTVLAVVLMLVRLKRSIRQAHPTQCTRCGEPFHTTDSPDVEMCSKCHHLFILKDGLHGESRKKKVDQVIGYQRSLSWIHRILTVFTPGLDLAFMGTSHMGFIEFSALSFGMGIVFATGRYVRFPGEIVPDPASIWQAFGGVLLAILFLRSWLKLLPRRS